MKNDEVIRKHIENRLAFRCRRWMLWRLRRAGGELTFDILQREAEDLGFGRRAFVRAEDLILGESLAITTWEGPVQTGLRLL